MAKVDPKEILLNNKGLLIVYAVALVPIALWTPVVGGVKDKFKKAQGALTQASTTTNDYAKRISDKAAASENPLYTQTDVERFTAKRELYQAQLGALGKIVNDADQNLERWFDAFSSTAAGSEPKASDYQTEYARQCALLAEKYKPFVTGDAGENYTFSDNPPPNDLRRYQKRFWIQEAVLTALEAASRSSGWSPEMQKQIDDPANQGKAMGFVKPIRLMSRFEFPAPPGNALNQPTTKPPVEPIPAAVVIDCAMPRLPYVVRELLARQIPLRVTSVKVDKKEFNIVYTQPPGVRVNIQGSEGLFEQDCYTTNLPDPALYRSQEMWIQEPSMRIEVRLEAYDFNKIEPPAPPKEE